MRVRVRAAVAASRFRLLDRCGRCGAEIVSFGPLGASVVVEFRDGRFGEGLVLQKELQYLRESRRGAGAELGEVVSAFAAPSPTVEGKYDVFLRPPSVWKSTSALGYPENYRERPSSTFTPSSSSYVGTSAWVAWKLHAIAQTQ